MWRGPGPTRWSYPLISDPGGYVKTFTVVCRLTVGSGVPYKSEIKSYLCVLFTTDAEREIRHRCDGKSGAAVAFHVEGELSLVVVVLD